MFLINLIIIFVYIMLAIISRKHFSKYKKKEGKCLAVCIFFAMGETLYKLLGKGVKHGDISKKIRKCNVVSPGSLKEISKRYIVTQISLVLAVFFAFNLVSGIYCLRSELHTEERSNVLVRDDYGGKEEEYVIHLEMDGMVYEYFLNVAPMEYSIEEIYQKADEVGIWLEQAILGDNIDLQHVSKNLKLPDKDEEGLFEITWDSDNPMLITSRGEINRENIKDKAEVVLTAKMTYLDYSFEKEICVALEVTSEDAVLAEVKKMLNNLEKENRYIKTVKLPTDIQGVKVSMREEGDSDNVKIMLSGIVLCGCIFAIGRERLKEAEKKRDAKLLAEYPPFVNKLYLLLWTGMTIKNAFAQYSSKAGEKDLLAKEIEYTLNQINSGVNEVAAYEELGQRLMIPEYSRLMNQIAHNIKRGDYDLFNCMEKEVSIVLNSRKENAKRLGEEASTKLLVPMILLMVITMVIVMVPALFSF